jgi:acid phosphatase type 7
MGCGALRHGVILNVFARSINSVVSSESQMSPVFRVNFCAVLCTVLGWTISIVVPAIGQEKVQEKIQDKVVGILLAAGDIVTCSSDDIRSGKATAELVKREIARANKEFSGIEVRVLALGDLSYPSGASMDCFAKTWGQFEDKILPVPGNHDYETNNAAAYFKYFNATFKAIKADPKLGYYAVDFPAAGESQWRLIAFNSSTSTGADSGQLKWLRNELKQTQGKRCVLAFSHAFFYSSGRHGHDDGKGKPQNKVVDTTKPLLPGKEMRAAFSALYTHRASVFVAGHDHHYEQLGRASDKGKPDDNDNGKSAIAADGVRSFVVGTGGKRLYSAIYDKKWAFTEAYDFESYGILRLVLRTKSYDWEFLPIKDNAASMKVLKKVNSDTCNQ